MNSTTISSDAQNSEKAARLLASALKPSPVTEPHHNWDPPELEEVAAWFPDYDLDLLIGRGSMGAVYRADQRKLERRVAIKLLPPALAQREGMEARFEQEAQAMAQLNHANIVALHDFGRTAEGHLFIVMEYVEGADLSRIIHAEEGGVDVPQALGLVSQVCDALQYAHGRGFVHRDIKPSNILVDKAGTVKIADFGLAKLLAESGEIVEPDAAQLTMTGAAVGTPDYTAPEQLKGEEIDHRADIYSLGVMFYEMLTGDLPRGAWSKPSALVPAANDRIDEVVSRAMQAEPDDRFQQASDVKLAVEGANELRAPARSSAKRKRVLVGCALCVGGGLLGAALVDWQPKSKETDEDPIVVVQTTEPVAEPSQRSLKEMNKLIESLADAQEHDAWNRKNMGGVKTYRDGFEQEEREKRLAELRDKLASELASGFRERHALAIEAQNRMGLLEKNHLARSLPDLPGEECLIPEWRSSFGYGKTFTGEDLIPGINPVVWSEKNGNNWHYYVEPVRLQNVPVGDKNGDLQDYPDFWPIDVPLARPTLPLCSPLSQAEADWLMEQYAEHVSSESPGLVLAEFDASDNPQQAWKYWSRHVDDLLPWAEGHPVPAPAGVAKGRLVLKEGVCLVVFDDVARPRLCGGGYVDAAGWVTHLQMWARMGVIAQELSGNPIKNERPWPGRIGEMQGRFGDYCAPDCVAFQEDALRKHRPYMFWWREVYQLGVVQEMRAGTNTGGSIKFKKFPNRRVLVTSFVCSRDRAEKIAKHHGGRLLQVTGQESLNELFGVIPDGLMAHTNVSAEILSSVAFWNGDRVSGRAADKAGEIPDGSLPAVLQKEDAVYVMAAPARALLVLEWPTKK